MSAQPTPAEPYDDDQLADDAQYYRGVLHEMIDAGMRFVRHVDNQREDAAEDVETVAELAVTYERVTRAVRRTVMLARQLHDPARADQTRIANRKRILRAVEDTIHHEDNGPNGPVDAERLQTELQERLDALDTDDEISHRPIGDLITELRRDLGLGGVLGRNPWKRRTPADIAELRARAAQPRTAPPSTAPTSAAHPPRPQERARARAGRPRQTAPERHFSIIATPNGA